MNQDTTAPPPPESRRRTRSQRALFVIGRAEPELHRRLSQVADRAELCLVEDPWQVLTDGDAPRVTPAALVLDLDASGGLRACAAARAERGLSDVPMIGVTRAVSDLGFAEALFWGIDDVVERNDAAGLTERLRSLDPRDEPRAQIRRGSVVIADGDTWRRERISRLLKAAGYEARVADLGGRDGSRLGAGDEALVVAEVDASRGRALAALRAAREAGSKTPWILTTPQPTILKVRREVEGLGAVAVHDAYAPPDHVLFLANELTLGDRINMRSSPRTLYGTRVWLRPEGREHDTLGYSYNVSEGGLFVRTLAPAVVGDRLWLELCSPRTARRVRLTAEVVRRCVLAPAAIALSPPGLALKIVAGLGADLERFRAGCRAIAADRWFPVDMQPARAW